MAEASHARFNRALANPAGAATPACPPKTCSGGRGGPKPGGDDEMILTLAQVQLGSV